MSFERHFIETVNRIEPDIGLKEKVTSLYSRTSRRKVPVLKYAISFILVMTVLAGGSLFWPLQSVQRKSETDMGSILPPLTGFIVVTNAIAKNSSSQTEMKPGQEFRIVNGDGASVQMVGGYTKDGKNEKWEGFFSFQLKCIGNSIKKVTYTTNHGEFQNLVRLNVFQYAYYNKFGKMPPFYDNLTPAPGAMNDPMAYQPVGETQALAPDSDGELYLKLTMNTYNEFLGDNDLKFTTNVQRKMLDGTKIKIMVAFQNGTQSSKTVRLSYPEAIDPNSYITASIVDS